MTVELNQYIVRSFYATIEKDGMQAADPFLADDFRAQVVGLGEAMDRQAFKRFGALFFKAFAGLCHNINAMVAERDRVVAILAITGTHWGVLEGILPTGQPVTIPAMAAFRFEAGRITEVKMIFDQLGMLQQLGGFPKSEDLFARSRVTLPVQ